MLCCQEPPAVINCWGRFFVKFCPRFLDWDWDSSPSSVYFESINSGETLMMFPDNSDERVFSPSSSLQSLQSVSNNFKIRQSEGIFLRQGLLLTWANFSQVKVRMLGIAAGENFEIFVIKIFLKIPACTWPDSSGAWRVCSIKMAHSTFSICFFLSKLTLKLSSKIVKNLLENGTISPGKTIRNKKTKGKSKHQLDKAWLILEMYLRFNPKNSKVISRSSEVQAGYKSPLEN